MRKLPHTAAEDLLEIVMRRYERFSTLLTSNRRVEDWGKLLGDVAAVSAMLDRLLHHGHVLKCGPLSWRTKTAAPTGQWITPPHWYHRLFFMSAFHLRTAPTISSRKAGSCLRLR